MVKRRSETERSTDRSIERKADKARRDADAGSPPRLPTPPRLSPPTEPSLEPRAPRLPDVPVARPGRRAEAPSDVVLTHRIERITVEPTPAPLPPSPAAADAERWFEQVPTNPGAPTTPTDRRGSTTRMQLVDPAQVQPGGAPPWLFPLLLALTALTVGMVIGALVFGGAGHGKCEPCTGDAGTSR